MARQFAKRCALWPRKCLGRVGSWSVAAANIGTPLHVSSRGLLGMYDGQCSGILVLVVGNNTVLDKVRLKDKPVLIDGL